MLRLDNVVRVFRSGGMVPFASTYAVRAVDGVSLSIAPGSTLGLVGESGCGKTTIANLILRIERPDAGRVLFRDQDVNRLSRSGVRWYQSSVQAVFQDPFSSLNPRMTVDDIVGEPLRVGAKPTTPMELTERVGEVLSAVGLHRQSTRAFPHELSGGQRQRVAVARALVSSPELVVLDEPVSSLDVSVAAQLMNLLNKLQERLGLAYLLIAHNLAVVRFLSEHIAVMYLGQVVETGLAPELVAKPLHPFTQALVAASTTFVRGEQKGAILGGEPVPATLPPRDCRFRFRCPYAFERCSREEPLLRDVSPGRSVACHLY